MPSVCPHLTTVHVTFMSSYDFEKTESQNELFTTYFQEFTKIYLDPKGTFEFDICGSNFIDVG